MQGHRPDDENVGGDDGKKRLEVLLRRLPVTGEEIAPSALQAGTFDETGPLEELHLSIDQK